MRKTAPTKNGVNTSMRGVNARHSCIKVPMLVSIFCFSWCFCPTIALASLVRPEVHDILSLICLGSCMVNIGRAVQKVKHEDLKQNWSHSSAKTRKSKAENYKLISELLCSIVVWLGMTFSDVKQFILSRKKSVQCNDNLWK